MSISYQNGDPTLEVHEYISYGQIIEVWNQIKKGQREYDPFAIFSEDMKHYYIEKYLKDSND